MTWQEQALCANAETDFWFSDDQNEQRKAIAFCEVCPVKQQCLAYILSFPREERVGIFGGVLFVDYRIEEKSARDARRWELRKARGEILPERYKKHEQKLAKQRERQRGYAAKRKSTLDTNQQERVG